MAAVAPAPAALPLAVTIPAPRPWPRTDPMPPAPAAVVRPLLPTLPAVVPEAVVKPVLDDPEDDSVPAAVVGPLLFEDLAGAVEASLILCSDLPLSVRSVDLVPVAVLEAVRFVVVDVDANL